jgi:hypothetical protein
MSLIFSRPSSNIMEVAAKSFLSPTNCCLPLNYRRILITDTTTLIVTMMGNVTLGRLTRLSRRALFQRIPPLENKRTMHATQLSCLPSKGKSERQRRQSKRHHIVMDGSSEADEKKRSNRHQRQRSKKSSSFHKNPSEHVGAQYLQTHTNGAGALSRKTKEPDKNFLRLASEWTQPSSQASQHPSVQKIWDRVTIGKVIG